MPQAVSASASNTERFLDTVLIGTTADDSLSTVGGDDILFGLRGDDLLRAGAGSDVLVGGEGADTLHGGAGFDYAYYLLAEAAVQVSLALGRSAGGAGADVLEDIENLFGSRHDDLLLGDDGANEIAGFRGHDVLRGAAGDDRLFGGAGDDQIDGGEGNDTVLYAGPQARYDITSTSPGSYTVVDRLGFDGTDTLSSIETLLFGQRGPGVYLLGALDGGLLEGSDGVDTAIYADADAAVAVDLGSGTVASAGRADLLQSIEAVIGSRFADLLRGDAGDNRLNGGAGADRLEGGAGADVYVVDDAGDDVVEAPDAPGAAVPDNTLPVDLGGAIDKVVASIDYALTAHVEQLELAVGAGNLAGTGNALDNTLTGNPGNNVLQGAAGDDLIDGREGLDIALYTGARSSFVVSLVPDGSLRVHDGSGAEGQDSLYAVERLHFSDAALAMDCAANQAAGMTALLLGALLGQASLADTALVAAVLAYFDTGPTLEQACTLLVDGGVTASLAGGADNAALARLVVRNVAGIEPDEAMTASLAALMHPGTGWTQPQFLAAAAVLPLNQSHVNLVGLAHDGLLHMP